MSRLNASAFEFVPGKRFGSSAQQQPQAPPQPAFVRPEEPEAPPAPPPTISLSIGGAKPAPAAPPAARDPVPAHAPSATPPASAKPQPQQAKATVPSSSSSTPSRTPGNGSPAPGSAPSTKAFTLGRAKTDTAAIAQEVATVADREMLEDLFGDSASPFPPTSLMTRCGTLAADG